MQFEIGISTILCLPPKGTAGFERSLVSGKSRVPFPPPRMMDSTFATMDPPYDNAVYCVYIRIQYKSEFSALPEKKQNLIRKINI